MVWLQGVVESVTEDKTEVVLRDEEALATLTVSDLVPGGADGIHAGSYIMAVGTVESAGRGCPLIVAVLRLSDLSSNSAHKLSWPLEVYELKQILFEQSKLSKT
ncbi:RecQ-mediated genome instability protein 2 [Trinorchestia longiramus]|nr:RecQ-mediated genome instability protein 2 [Trinorchestia longiramus]